MGHNSNLIFAANTSRLSSASTHLHPPVIRDRDDLPHGPLQESDTAPWREQSATTKVLACGNPSIMIVGCDNGLRSLLRAYLQHVGFEVIGCGDLEAAFRALVNGRSVNLLLVDSQMLEASSPVIRESFADKYPDLALFVISGRRMSDGTLREIKYRKWEPDSKPFLLPELLGRIQASLENGFDFRSGISRGTSERSDKVVSISARGKTSGIRPATGNGF